MRYENVPQLPTDFRMNGSVLRELETKFHRRRKALKQRAILALGQRFSGTDALSIFVRKHSAVTFPKLGCMGQFGNQLFQISAVLGYAAEYGCRPVLPEWHCEQTDRHHDSYFPAVRAFYGRVRGPLLAEKNFSYEKLPFVFNANLAGYFQSEKYFEAVAPQVKKLFAEPEAITRRLDDYCAAHGLSDFDGLHIRSYLHERDQGDGLEMLPDAYFKSILATLRTDRPLVIATDKKKIAADLLSRCPVDRPVHMLTFDEDLLDFYMLSRASRIAISNSSFGWWAAYLGKKKELILAPDHRHWFRAATRPGPGWSTKDIYPSAFREVTW